MVGLKKIHRSSDEIPIPLEWRPIFNGIVESIINNDFLLNDLIHENIYISNTDADLVKQNIKNYGENIVSLPDLTWETSVCRWTGSHWSVLIDLFTHGQISDLVLFANVFENERGYKFEVESVHVP